MGLRGRGIFSQDQPTSSKYRPTEEARNKYVARMTHKKVRYEFGAYDTPAEAHQAYLDGREKFIQAQLKDIWVSHWNL